MEKSSMFQYLYNGILSQIRAGRYIYGSSLPSAAELCRIYNVGIRTARDVLKALRDDGYIRTEERRRATVIHGTEDAGNEANLRETLARRNCMSEVYDAMELLMTPLLIFCAQQCGDDELLAVDAGAKKMTRLSWIERWRLSSQLLHTILKKADNPLFNDLYSSLELYAKIPFFEGYRHPFEIAADEAEHNFRWRIESLVRRNYHEADRRLRSMYSSVRSYVESYLQLLAEDGRAVCPPEQEKFHWDAAKGKVYLYAEIVRDITHEISLGRWRDGCFLPASKELAAHYGVSLYVVRQALKMLEGRGFIVIRNGRRAQVSLASVGADIRRFSEPEQKRDIWVYLHALQLMTVLFPHAARLAADRFTEEQRLYLRESLDKNGVAVIRSFVECVFEALPSETLRTIFKEINGLLLWGEHLMYQPGASDRVAALARLCRQALSALDRGDNVNFAGLLNEIFIHVLLRMKKFAASAGMPEVRKIKVPASRAAGSE